MLKHIPLFVIVFAVYNIVAFAGGESVLQEGLFTLSLVSGAAVQITTDILLVLFGLIIMTIELFKATRSSVASIIDHALSTLVFIAFLIEFILVKQVGTPGFLILMLLSLLDVIAGFTVTISSARRDVAFER